MDLRDYSALIREQVKQVNEKDPNWKWSVRSIGKYHVRIQWGYLDYLEEKNNCFHLWLDQDETAGCWIHIRRPQGELIEAYLVVEGKPNPQIGAEQTIHNGLRDAIEEIAYTAHHYY